jgi:hypothetical protein
MMRAWIAVALLALSWLLGLHYYQPPDLMRWAVAVLLGVVLLGGLIERLPGRREMVVTLLLLILPTWFIPWPYRAAPLLIVVGLAIELAPIPARWPRWLGRGALAAGLVLSAQSLAILGYADQTARCHDLPRPLAWLAGQLAWLLGADVAVDGGDLAIRVLDSVHRLGATWELILDPATLGFFAGGLVVLGLAAWSELPPGRGWSPWLRGVRAFSLVVVAWLPMRLALVLGLYLNRSMLVERGVSPIVMGQFFSPWLYLLLLAGAVLLTVAFVRHPGAVAVEADEDGAEDDSGTATAGRRPWHVPAALATVGAGVAILTGVLLWDPVGRPKEGRIVVVERHSAWEPTLNPYDTTRYGEPASYNYAAVYRYLSQFFSMSQLPETDRINDERLAECDVLVVKTPTARYSDGEVAAIGRFVARGGGLLLIGDHTNVFRSSTYLNDIARQFGFTYRNDLLFCIGSPYEQHYEPPPLAHAAVQNVAAVDFAVGCSIDPGTSQGRAAIRNTGLWSLSAIYDSPNYHPPAEYRPQMRYGSFIQLWATHHGDGRVLAFTDSTVFSNFCTFQPGKAELLLGMVDWLNHGSFFDSLWRRLLLLVPLALVAVALLLVGLGFAYGHSGLWLPLIAAGLFAWTLAAWGVETAQRRRMPPPVPERPIPRVVIDRTTSEAPLAKGAYNESDDGLGFGMLEHWIPRLDCYTVRESGPAAFSGDLLVTVCPTRSVSREFREGLVEYVARGGKLLVLDSPVSEGSTANSLLWPFGLGVKHAATGQPGRLAIAGNGPGIPLDAACQVTGGEPFARLGTMPVGARAKYGHGEVMAIGFGYLFNDNHMGAEWIPQPNAETRAKYEVLYALVRALLNGGPVVVPKQAETKGTEPEAPAVPGGGAQAGE